MALWSTIHTGFDSNDETINFGTRAVALGSTSVYETNTLATIECSSEKNPSVTPKCNSIYSNHKLGVSLDKTFLLFDQSCQSVLCNISFDNVINAFEISEDGEFVFFGLSSLDFYYLNLASPDRLLSKRFEADTSNEGDHILQIISKTSKPQEYNIYVILASGKICLANLHKENLEILTFDIVKSSISMEFDVVVQAFYRSSIDELNVIFVTQGLVQLWEPRSGSTQKLLMDKECQIKKIRLNNFFAVALTNEGTLKRICLNTMTFVSKWNNEIVVDFTFVENFNEKIVYEILLLTKHNEICLIEPLSFTTKFKLETRLSSINFLIDKLSDFEEILYLENIREEYVTSVRVIAITDSNPEFRLERLLQRQKFVEAKEFANFYGLSLELVYKTKVKWLMGELHLLNKIPEEKMNEYFAELLSLLELIKDEEFVGECCIKTISPDILKTRELIEYAINRLLKSTERSTAILELMKSLKFTLSSIGTFLLINEVSATSEQWINFSTSNPIIICQQFLLKEQISEASIVCKRNRLKMKRELSIEMAHSLFEILPQALSIENTLQWLNCYTPILLSTHPQSLSRLISWVIKKAKNVEHQDPTNWPRKALSFTQSVLLLTKDFVNNVIEDQFPLHQSESLPGSSLNELDIFSLNLHYLCILKEEHSIEIDYYSFTHGIEFTGIGSEQNVKAVLPLLFDYVPQRGIKNLIQKFVVSYCGDYYKEIDAIISSYINNLLNRYSSEWYSESTQWEERCVEFVNCINDITEKLKALSTVLSKASVPWSKAIQTLVDSVFHFKHPLVDPIKIHYNNIPKKIVLKKYGLEFDKVDLSDTTGLLLFLFNENENALEDAKILLENGKTDIEIYVTMWCIAIEKGKCEDVFLIIKKEVSIDDLMEICKSTITYIFKQDSRRVKNTKFYIEALDFISVVCESVNSDISQANLEAAASIKITYDVKSNYGLIFNPSDMIGKKREIVLSDCIHLSERESKLCKLFYSSALNQFPEIPINLNISKNSAEILRFNKLLTTMAVNLQIPHDRCLFEMTYQCCISEKIEAMSYFISLLNETNFIKSNHHDMSNLLEAALKIYTSSVDKDNDVIDVLMDTATLLAIHCPSRCTIRNFDLMKICKLFVMPNHKPEWSTVYEDAMEPNHLYISEPIENALFGCAPVQSCVEGGGMLNRELEAIIQRIPNDLISFNRSNDLIWHLVKQNYVDLKCLKTVSIVATHTVSQIVLQMFQARNFDLTLALILLHHFQPDQAIQWLTNVVNKIIVDDLKWNNALGLLGKYYCEIHRSSLEIPENVYNFFHEMYIMSSWGIKIAQYGIPLKEACLDASDDRKKLLKKLIATPEIKLNVLQQFCNDMKIDEQKCFLLYLERLLLSWKPIFSAVKNKCGKKVLVVENDTDELLAKCRQVIYKITNEDNLTKLLFVSVWDQVTKYYYEVFLVILEIAPRKFPEKYQAYQMILNFLKTYIRISEVQESESLDWFTINPTNQSLPLIAQYRLPFNKFPLDSVKSLKSELSLDTYKLWLSAPVWQSNMMDKDLICSFTITNLKNGEANHPNSGGWFLQGRNQDLLEKIMECVNQISSYEIAVPALYFVVNRVMPPGIDQVEAAQQCFIKAEQWKEIEKGDNAVLGCARAEKKYLTVSTVHILHKYGLGNPEYINLALQPLELITALYHDPSLLKDSTTSMQKPNINKAVECIATLCGINIANVTLELLSKWLGAENKCQLMNDYQMSENQESANFSDNVKRACYMLLGCKDLGKVESYLVGIAFTRNQEENRRPVGVRLRALQCLTSITTVDHLQMITARDIDTIRNYFQILVYVYDLERYGFRYSIKGFEGASKESIILNLLKRPMINRLRLAARIARTYHIVKPSLWNELVLKMIGSFMETDLEILLPEIENLMIDVTTIRNAWKFVIERAVISQDYVKLMELVQSCPDTSYLDVKLILEYLNKIGQNDSIKVLESICNFEINNFPSKT